MFTLRSFFGTVPFYRAAMNNRVRLFDINDFDRKKRLTDKPKFNKPLNETD